MVVKESPPESTSKDWFEVLKPLTSDPGIWYRVASYEQPKTAYNVAYFLRSNTYKVPDGVWEFTGAKLDDGQGAVYAKFVQPND